jgi:hypothetical protein
MGEEWKWLIPKIIDTNAVARGIKLNIKYNPEKDDFMEWQYRMSSMVVKGCKTNLTALGKEYEISHNYESLHEATSDVLLNWKIWKKLVYQIEL